MNTFGGGVLFLDRCDINTDEIIPARYLTEMSKAALAPYLMEDFQHPGFEATRDTAGKQAIVTRANFGCGSSREHAAWALEVNGIGLVLAESFARIFRQNMFNCGLMAVELPAETIAALFARFSDRRTEVAVDMDDGRLDFSADGVHEQVHFALTEFDRLLVAAGGWIPFADRRY